MKTPTLLLVASLLAATASAGGQSRGSGEEVRKPSLQQQQKDAKSADQTAKPDNSRQPPGRGGTGSPTERKWDFPIIGRKDAMRQPEKGPEPPPPPPGDDVEVPFLPTPNPKPTPTKPPSGKA
jgi:hypothetical protein